MKYTIDEKCVCCGACMATCPFGAVYALKDRFAIDAEKCRGCGTCAKNCLAEAAHEKTEE